MKFKIVKCDAETRLQLIHYKNLRYYYHALIKEIMGKDYYTVNPDVMNSDTEAYEDMIYRIELDEDLVEKLFELVEFDTEPLDESSLVEEAIRILIEES